MSAKNFFRKLMTKSLRGQKASTIRKQSAQLGRDAIGLEDRVVPAAWVPQGPSPTINAQVTIPADNNPVNGAIQSIAAHPTNPDIIYAATVNGGVWKTTSRRSPRRRRGSSTRAFRGR